MVIELADDLGGDVGGTITSNLTADMQQQYDAFDHYVPAANAIESLVLAHARAGVDVTAQTYLKGLVTAVNEITNTYL